MTTNPRGITRSSLSVQTVKRLRFYTAAMLKETKTPSQVAHDWGDWYHLASAFVAAYGTLELADLEGDARFLRAGEVNASKSLTEADRAFLSALEGALDGYPEMRSA